LALIKSALPTAIKIISAPLSNLSALEFKGDNTIYDDYLSTAAAFAGIDPVSILITAEVPMVAST